MIVAQKRILSLRGPSAGEKAIDLGPLSLLINHTITTYPDSTVAGLPRLVTELVDENIVPLITKSRPLWKLVGRLALWRGQPPIPAYEKAWRAATAVPGWEESSSEAVWSDVADSTLELVDAYEGWALAIAEQEGKKGLDSTSLVGDWRFKARSAIRGILGKVKGGPWDGSVQANKLKARLDGITVRPATSAAAPALGRDNV